MANPFSSGRIPSGLADKIDAHLFNTGEIRSELLLRLLRAEVGDSKSNNMGDRIIPPPIPIIPDSNPMIPPTARESGILEGLKSLGLVSLKKKKRITGMSNSTPSVFL